MIMCCVQVTVPEKVDVLISELFGYMMFNERTLESYLHAKKWLKPGGKFNCAFLPRECNILISEYIRAMGIG